MPDEDRYLERQISEINSKVIAVEANTKMIPEFMKQISDVKQAQSKHDGQIRVNSNDIAHLHTHYENIETQLAGIYKELKDGATATATLGAKQWAIVAAVSFVISVMIQSVNATQ